MKNILVLVHDDPGQEARLQVALDLARLFDGHLTCVDVAMMPTIVAEYGVIAGAAELIANEIDSEHRNRDAIRARIASEDVPFSWIDATGEPGQALGDASGLADLVVVSRRLETSDYPDMIGLAGDLLTRAGRPVLAVPEGYARFDLDGRAVVAWDGSRDAEDALRAAVPLLAQVQSVMLLYAYDGSMRLPIESAAQYLYRHGIGCLIEERQELRSRPGDVILQAAASGGTKLVVMGGFGRSITIESLFGGASHRMLQASPVPVFLAHHR